MSQGAPREEIRSVPVPAGPHPLIEVNGKLRPRTDSRGRPLHATEEGLRNFWAWFGNSRAVDSLGRPLVIYHGTDQCFPNFDLAGAGQKDNGWYGLGIYTTPDRDTASAYAMFCEKRDGSEPLGAQVMPMYVRSLRPYRWTREQQAALSAEHSSAEITESLRAAGYDSVFVENGFADPDYASYYEIVVFDPAQLKSALGNSGSFAPGSADLLDARPGQWHGASADDGWLVPPALRRRQRP